MKTKVSVFIATSLDGYIARKDGGIDWAGCRQRNHSKGRGLWLRGVVETVDALVMGRNSYEKVLSFGKWPFGDMSVIVLSRNPIVFPDGVPDSVRHSSENPQVLCERLAGEGVEHIYIDGGNTIQRFLSAELVDELTITLIPVILGDGIPLFASMDFDLWLNCDNVRTFEFGFVQLKYSVKKRC